MEARRDYLIAPRKEWLKLRDPLRPSQVKKTIINRGNWGVHYKYSFIMGKEHGATQDHVAILLSNGRGQQPDTLEDQWALHQAKVLGNFSVDGVFKSKVMGNEAYRQRCGYPERKWATLMKVIELTVQGKTVQIEYMAPGGTYLPQRFIFYPFKAK